MADEAEMMHVKKNWHNTLECPICHEYFSAPILLCITGHSICQSCKVKTENCPLCKKQFSSGRNYALEDVIERSSFPCVNADFGCTGTVFRDSQAKHEKVCPYRLYECVPGKLDGCKWKGRKTEILGHVEKEHEKKAWMKTDNLGLHFKNFNIEEDFYDNQIISAYGEIFWFQSFISKLKKSFYISIHYIGHKENRQKYFYKIHFKSTTNSNHELLFSTETHPDTVQIQDLAKEKVTYFRLKHDMVKHFLKNGHLMYNIEIIHIP